MKKELKPFEKFKGAPEPLKTRGYSQKMRPIADAIRDLNEGEGVPIPVDPIWKSAGNAVSRLSQLAKNLHGAGSCRVRRCEDDSLVVVYRLKKRGPKKKERPPTGEGI